MEQKDINMAGERVGTEDSLTKEGLTHMEEKQRIRNIVKNCLIDAEEEIIRLIENPRKKGEATQPNSLTLRKEKELIEKDNQIT